MKLDVFDSDSTRIFWEVECNNDSVLDDMCVFMANESCPCRYVTGLEHILYGDGAGGVRRFADAVCNSAMFYFPSLGAMYRYDSQLDEWVPAPDYGSNGDPLATLMVSRSSSASSSDVWNMSYDNKGNFYTIVEDIEFKKHKEIEDVEQQQA